MDIRKMLGKDLGLKNERIPKSKEVIKNDVKVRSSGLVKPNIDQSWTMVDIVESWSPGGWEETFENAKADLLEIAVILDNKEKEHREELGSNEYYDAYYPLKSNIFKAFELCPLHEVKVVIIDLEPYNGLTHSKTPRAQGMSYSLDKEDELNREIVGIYELMKDTIIGFEEPTHGDLTFLAKQGILFLNYCLTISSDRKSHGDIWTGFIYHILNALKINCPDAIYVLWGNVASKMRSRINNKATVLEATSTFSKSTRNEKVTPFVSCNHFNKINKLLTSKKLTPIDWQIPE